MLYLNPSILLIFASTLNLAFAGDCDNVLDAWTAFGKTTSLTDGCLLPGVSVSFGYVIKV